MFLDARSVPTAEVADAAVCVVGGGAAGITLARELQGRGRKIVLVESGDLKPDRDTQALYAGEVSCPAYPPLEDVRQRYFGGTTNQWSGYCMSFDELDFKPRPWVPYSGWPISRATLLPFYRRAEATCRIPEFAQPPISWAEQLKVTHFPLDEQSVFHRVSFVNPVRFGHTYREELGSSNNILVYLRGNVTELKRVASGNSVEYATVKTLSGNQFRVTAKVFVLACGGIENARILMNSGGTGRNAIGNDYDLVGRFFMEHPKLYCGFLIAKGADRAVHFYHLNSHRLEGLDDTIHIKGDLGVSERHQEERQLVNTRITTIAVSSAGIQSVKRVAKALRAGHLPDDTASHVKSILKDFDQVYERLFTVVAGSGYEVYTVDTQFEHAPNPDSRVLLTTERDALGMQRVRLDCRLPEITKLTIPKLVQLLGEEFGRFGLGRAKFENQCDDDYWGEHVRWSNHAIGTTRMHDDPTQGVVDANCQVHGTSNLFIAGSSVFPTSGAATPTFTIVAMAIRLADRIHDQLTKGA